MCFLFYSTCQQCRSLIQSDLPRCWTTAKPKFFFGQVVGQDILVKTRQPQPSQKKTLDSALVVLPHPTCARQKKRAPYNRCAFYFIQHVNSVEVQQQGATTTHFNLLSAAFGAWRRGWSIPWLFRGCYTVLPHSVVVLVIHILTPKIKRQEETFTCLTQTGESSS